MATLATQPIERTGLVPTLVAATSGGDKFNPGDHTFLMVKNASGGSITVTVATPGTVDNLAIADVAVSVAAGATELIGPFPAALVGELSDGLAAITYSGVTTLTVAAVSV